MVLITTMAILTVIYILPFFGRLLLEIIRAYRERPDKGDLNKKRSIQYKRETTMMRNKQNDMFVNEVINICNSNLLDNQQKLNMIEKRIDMMRNAIMN